MSRGANRTDASKEGPLEFAVAGLAIAGMFIGLMWLTFHARIVASMTPLLRAIGSAWEWVPGELGVSQALSVYSQARVFIAKPADAGLFDFVGFFNVAIAPVTTVLTIVLAVLTVVMMMRPRSDIYRRFKNADQLLAKLSHVFTGTAPILHIRKDIAFNKDPLWARQRAPEEVLFEDHVNGLPLVTGDPNDPKTLKTYPDRLGLWFEGLEPVRVRAKQSSPGDAPRLHSRWLGNHVVDLSRQGDRRMFRAMPESSDQTFPDRFSDVGKAMFGMLCGMAFGGAEGVADARKACDQLNNSCRGAAHGLPNLSVAQWIFDKYRTNHLAHKLFAVHHWEYTYLFELFALAKRKGKFTDSNFRWLKPAARSLWYALNTVGRFTPHTESATVFSHHAYERKLARMPDDRIPFILDAEGKYPRPVIFTTCAVEGMVQAFEEWKTGTEENDDDWWKNKHQWMAGEPALNAAMQAPALPPDTDAARQVLASTGFDSSQAKARSDADAKTKGAETKALSALFEGGDEEA